MRLIEKNIGNRMSWLSYFTWQMACLPVSHPTVPKYWSFAIKLHIDKQQAVKFK